MILLANNALELGWLLFWFHICIFLDHFVFDSSCFKENPHSFLPYSLLPKGGEMTYLIDECWRGHGAWWVSFGMSFSMECKPPLLLHGVALQGRPLGFKLGQWPGGKFTEFKGKKLARPFSCASRPCHPIQFLSVIKLTFISIWFLCLFIHSALWRRVSSANLAALKKC